jgi:transposase
VLVEILILPVELRAVTRYGFVFLFKEQRLEVGRENKGQIFNTQNYITEGAEASGFTGDVWTVKRVKAATRRKLDIKAGATTIRKVLIEEGFSVQKPQVEARQKKQAQVDGFRGGWEPNHGWAGAI